MPQNHTERYFTSVHYLENDSVILTKLVGRLSETNISKVITIVPSLECMFNMWYLLLEYFV